MSQIIDRALEVAALAHRNQVRKGTNIPYIMHPCAVGIILARAGCDDEIIAAGLLHDTVEDTPLTLADIDRDCGPRVASIVEGCSEPDKSLPWEARKEHTIGYLRHAPWEVRVVSCADKLHNASTMLASHEADGDAFWDRFKRGRVLQEWYYRSLVEVLCNDPPDERPIPFCNEFRQVVDELFGPGRSEA